MEIIGHDNLKRRILTAVKSARKRNTAPPHMLFSGHAGCGKTTMAKALAEQLGAPFISVVPEHLKNMKALLDLFEALDYSGYDEKGNRVGKVNPTIIFLDECHRLPIFGQEKLGIAMENFHVSTGQANKFYWLPYFTVVGATTLAGNLSKPFLDRFKLTFMFEPYDQEDSCSIIKYHAQRMDVLITGKAIREIARRSRGVPRIMVRHLEQCRDTMLAFGSEIITSKVAEVTFESLGIDRKGLNLVERKLLKTLYDSDGAVGLETLAIVTGESQRTLKEETEVFLIQQGYLTRKSTGRSITPKGRAYLEEEGYVGRRNGRVMVAANYQRK